MQIVFRICISQGPAYVQKRKKKKALHARHTVSGRAAKRFFKAIFSQVQTVWEKFWPTLGRQGKNNGLALVSLSSAPVCLRYFHFFILKIKKY